MDLVQVDAFLRMYSNKERLALQGQGGPPREQAEYAHFQESNAGGRRTYVFENEYFLRNGELIGIYRQDRYSSVYAHRHNYVELCYIWSGVSRQVICGENVSLARGALCIFDMAASHTIAAAGDDDIIINILMRPEFFDKLLERRIAGDGVLMEFLTAAVRTQQQQSHYLCFETESIPQVRWLIQLLVREYFSEYPGKEQMLENYMASLFTELFRIYDKDNQGQSLVDRQRKQLSEILKYIERNFEQCTVQSAAQAFGLSPKYLTMLLKKRTGRSFVEHIQEQKFTKARRLLANTDLPIVRIVELCGYSNEHFFYEKFKQSAGMTPGKYRKQFQKDENR